MRSLLTALVVSAAILLPALALAKPPTSDPAPVEVVNDPLLVEVVNPAAPATAARWQLVGFTATAYTGNMGGNFGVTEKLLAND